ncbi:putative Major facilitator superfamily (MFS) profile domain-containing protein [Seiridium cardinale]|uniref:Major facilitator superfamily (MFS) profile domain-containing protein n=1 Tax=Seiridium cardinale TaxID=138064 RepID=A0ABR2XL31_9PEZI
MEQKIEKPLLVESRIDPRYDLTALTVEDAEFLASFSEEARKRVIWKVDIRLIPMLTILHLISFLDCSNMGNAKIEGLDDELQLDGVKYNIALCIFFIPYILCAAGAFSGLLAFAIANTNGVGGYRAWRWIFIIEGLASALAGVAAFLFMPDSPRSYGCFLTSDKIRYLEVRQLTVPGRRKHGHGEGGSNYFDWKNLVKILKDWQRYLLAIVYLSSIVPNYALKFIIKNMGYQSSMAQVLTIPP